MALLAVTIGLSSCLQLNSVDQLNPGGTAPGDHRAVLVFGLRTETEWPRYGMFGISLHRYSMADQNIAGGCFWDDRAHAASRARETEYFVFSVPAGHYVLGPVDSVEDLRELYETAFAAPAGRIVYIGDFIYRAENGGTDTARRREFMELRQNPRAASDAIHSYTQLSGDMAVANKVRVTAPTWYLCTP
jgi:hypothetical protein